MLCFPRKHADVVCSAKQVCDCRFLGRSKKFTKKKNDFFVTGEQYTETCTIFQKSCIDKMNYDFIINSHLKNCDCLPDCTSITYELETANDPQKFKTKNQTE